ncbi:prepilin peptidase [Anaerosporobacter sp.]
MRYCICKLIAECSQDMVGSLEENSSCTYNAMKSIQFPLLEGLNGGLYILILYVKGFSLESCMYCIITSVLLIISIVDWHTFEIPFVLNKIIFIASLVIMFIDWPNRLRHAIGFLAISVLLYLIFILSKGRAIGGGDIKLMAAAGLGLGASKIVVAFFMACIVGSIIHVLRMKITKKDHMLALGPYLAFGIFITMIYGDQLINWYFNVLLSSY